MIDLVQQQDIRSLIEETSSPCISIYMPAFRAGVDTLQNPIRFKNQLKEAERKLADLGLRSTDTRALLEPVRELVDDYQFWQSQSDGLALFRCADFHRHFRVPQEFEELVVVTDRFHLKPLLKLFYRDSHYYVLCLSTNSVRLLECTWHGADEVQLPASVPASLAEAVGEAAEPEVHVRSVGQGPGGGQVGVFYGQDEGKENKENLARYFREIDRGLRGVLQDDGAPLVLAGVDYLLPIYTSVSNYPNLISDGIKGNVETLRPGDIQQKASPIVAPLFAETRERAAAQYRQRAAEGKAASDLGQVVRAAHHGRVETLLVGVGIQRWGRYDPNTDQVETHQTPAPGDEDLLDLAAVATLLNRGTVFAVEPQRVPDGAELAAILRY